MPFSSKFSVLLAGASGYLGGTLLTALVKKYPDAEITALARSSKDDDKLKAAGVKAIVHAGSDNPAEVTRAASQADVVINAANADDLPLVKALIDGLAERKKSTGIRGIFIETSGTAVVSDEAAGNFDPNLKPVNDAVEGDIASIPSTAIHRNVDEVVFAADKSGDISGYIIAPAIIWGKGSGPVNRPSLAFGLYLSILQAFKRGIIIGDGSAITNSVHVDDAVALYLLILDRALAEKDLEASPYAKYYFASTHDQSHKSLLEVVVKHLHAKGIFSSPSLEQVSIEEALKGHSWAFFMARNSYIKAERGAAIGWKPAYAQSIPTQEIIDGLDGVLAAYA